MTDDLHSVLNQLEDTVQRSQVLASQTHQISRLQTEQLEQAQRTMDKSSKHLKDVEQEIDELEKGFCVRLCCSSKTRKRKSKDFRGNQSEENLIDIEQNSIYSNNQLTNLDQNLQKLKYFNTLIDREIQDQIQTLNNLHHQVDTDSYKLTEANFKTKHL